MTPSDVILTYRKIYHRSGQQVRLACGQCYYQSTISCRLETLALDLFSGQ